MSYLSLYRKYRSQTFGDLVGQGHVVTTLQNAIATERIAHAYLFTGPRGTGKTSSARLLAKALNATGGPNPNPPEDDPIGLEIASGTCVDVIEMDAASEAGVDSIREAIIENVQYQPMSCRYKIFIIDEVHDLSPKAFDALLKTIEEPPAHVIFILATTEYNKVPPTIRSRCQKFEFHRGSIQDLVSRLQFVAQAEGADIEPAAVTAIARMADGGFRDALTLLEQAILTTDGTITLRHVYDQLGLIPSEIVDGLFLAIKSADVPKIIDILNEVARLGRDPRALLESMLHRASELTRASYGIDVGALTDSTAEAALHEVSAQLGRDFLLQIRAALTDAHKVIRDITLPRLWLESELIRLATEPVSPVAKATHPAENTPKAKTSEAPPRKSEAKAPETTPEPTPEPAPEPAPVAVVETGDPVLDQAQASWLSTVEILGSKSPLMKIKLSDSKVRSAADNLATIEIAHQVNLEWICASTKRSGAIVEELTSRLGPDWKVEFVAGPKDSVRNEPQAVELPLEGQKLADTVREIFGTN